MFVRLYSAANTVASIVSRAANNTAMRIVNVVSDPLARMQTGWRGSYSYSLLDNHSGSSSSSSQVRLRDGNTSRIRTLSGRFNIDWEEVQYCPHAPNPPPRTTSLPVLAQDLLSAVQEAGISGARASMPESLLAHYEHQAAAAAKSWPPTDDKTQQASELADFLEAADNFDDDGWDEDEGIYDVPRSTPVTQDEIYMDMGAMPFAPAPEGIYMDMQGGSTAEELYLSPEPIYQNRLNTEALYDAVMPEPIYEKMLPPNAEDLPELAKSLAWLYGELEEAELEEPIYENMAWPAEGSTEEPIYVSMEELSMQGSIENVNYTQHDFTGFGESSTDDELDEPKTESGNTESLKFVAGSAQPVKAKEIQGKASLVFSDSASGESDA